MSKTLSQEELQKLRKSLISKMEYGNRLQGIDLILRHPERGYLITQHNTSVINLARTYLKRATLVSDFRFSEYACALPEQRASMSASATLEMRKFNNEYQEDYYQGGGTSSLSNHMASSAANNMPQPNNTNSNSHSIPLHIFFELKGCAASLCLPGEYAELHFSLYNRKDSKFVTEKFVVFVNSSGHAAEELQGRSPMRTVFQDLDFSESGNDLALVCQIIRVGKMNVSEREGLGDKAGFVVSPGILLPHSLSVSSLASMQSTTTTSSNFSLYNHSTTATNRSSTNPRPKRQNFVRRPFGCAVLNLEELDESKERPTVANISNNNNLIANQLSASLMDSSAKNGEHTIRIFVPSSDNIFSSLHDHILANNTSAYETSSRAEYLEVKVSAHTSVDVLQLVKDHIQQPDTILTPRKYTSLDILPLGKRNSMYFSLINAEFSQGRKATAKNVEVSIQVRLNSGEFVENCICVTPTFPVSTYDSVVYYHNNNPKWNETICVNLDAYTFEKAHLFITYRHVSSSSVKLDKNSGRNHQNDKNEKNIAFSFLPLLRGDRTVVGDGNHTLSMYKYDAKLVVPAVYLNYPAGPRLFVYAGFDLPGDNLALATECMAKLPLINKDFIHVKTYLCSSVLTQNLALHKILRWSTLDGILKNLTDSCSSPGSSKNVNGIIAALKEFSLIGEVEIVKFLPSLLSSLFALLSSPCNSSSSSHSISETMGPLDTEILMALVFILSIVHDRRFTTHRSILDAFIEEKVGPLAPKAWLNLTVAFQKLVLDGIHEKDSGGRAKDLRNGLKMWKDVMRCCVKSWVYYKETRSQMEVEEETLDFPSLLDRVLKSINALMSQSNPPHIIATQTLAFKSFPVLVNILKSILETDRVLSIVFTFFSHCRGGILKLNGHRLVSMSGLIKSAFLTCDHGPDFNPVRYRTELVTNMVKELLEWAEGGWGLTTKAPLTPSRTQSQPSHYHLQQQQLKMLPDKENFRQWVVTISDMVDRAHRLLEEEGYIDESQYDLTFAQGGSSLYVIKSICHMLPKLLFLYNNMESCISPATFVVAAAAAVGKSETFQATTTTGKKDAYLPKSQGSNFE